MRLSSFQEEENNFFKLSLSLLFSRLRFIFSQFSFSSFFNLYAMVKQFFVFTESMVFLYQMPWQDLETHQHYIHCHQLTVILVLQAAFLLSQWNVSYKSCIGYVFNICYSSLTHKFLEIFTKTRKKRNQFIKWKFLLLICL